MRILFVDLPFASLYRPNLGLESVAAGLRRDGCDVQVWYAKLDFASRIGIAWYDYISERVPASMMLGDLVFSSKEPAGSPLPDSVRERLPWLRAHARAFVEDASLRIRESRVGLLGLGLTYQLTPGLEVARAVSLMQERPAIVVGGAYCEGSMGRALFEKYSFLDYVCQGEGEETTRQLVRALAAQQLDTGGPVAEPIPSLLVRTELHSGSIGPTGATLRLDSLAPPDYEDWLEQTCSSGLGLEASDLSVVFETSRGCWFGEKSHCVFCGLNGETIRYRSKSPARIRAELEAIAKLGVRRADAADLILDMRFFDTLLPEMRGLPLSFYFETKSNLRRRHFSRLSGAGVDAIQPGIESLDTEALRWMKKGTTALQNVRTLKLCSEYRIIADWNLLVGLPGDFERSYQRQAALIPLLQHLQPPSAGCAPLNLVRFSPLFESASQYGLGGVRAVAAHRMLFGPDGDDLAYYFEWEGPTETAHAAAARAALVNAVRTWEAEFGRCAFLHLDDGDRIVLYDTRSIAREHIAHLCEDEAVVYRLLDEGRSTSAIQREASLSRERVDRIVDRFMDHSWVVALDGKCLALSVDARPLLPREVLTAAEPAVASLLYQAWASAVAQRRPRPPD